MTDPQTITQLIEDLQAAEVGTRELDTGIAKTVGFYPEGIEDIGCYYDPASGCAGGDIYSPPDYTASIDAAMTTIPEGWYINGMSYDEVLRSYIITLSKFGGYVSERQKGVPKTGKGIDMESIPLAICIASLYAILKELETT